MRAAPDVAGRELDAGRAGARGPVSLRAAATRLFADPGVRLAIAAVVALRVVLGVVMFLGDTHTDRLHPVPNGSFLFHLLIEPWERADGVIYEHIALTGYHAQGNDTAFFPLYPALIRALTFPLGANVTAAAIAALAIATLSLVAGLACVHAIAMDHGGREVADRAVLYMAVYPLAVFLVAPYAESLFLALSAGTVLAARRERFAVASLLCALAALTRPFGVLLLAPLAIEVACDARRRLRSGQGWFRPVQLTLVVPALAWIGYQLGAAFLAGLSEADAEKRGWGVVLVAPWTSIRDAVRFALERNPSPGYLNIIAAVGLVVAVALAWRMLPASLAAYVTLSAVAILCHEVTAFPAQGPLKSADRFVGVVFPVFIILAVLGRRYRWLSRAVIVAFPLVLLYDTYKFGQDTFVA